MVKFIKKFFYTNCDGCGEIICLLTAKSDLFGTNCFKCHEEIMFILKGKGD